MSYERITYFQRYIGTSTEEKPTYDENVAISLQPGAEFFETDTLVTWAFTGDSWEIKEVSDSNKALILYQSGTDLYLCKAPIGTGTTEALWQVKKIDTTSGIVISWADGNSKFDNVATDLATVAGFTYS